MDDIQEALIDAIFGRRPQRTTMNKVYGGTVRHHGGPSLCLSCRNATVVTHMRGIHVECHNISHGQNGMPQPVIECSSYDDKSHPSRRDFQQIGWVLNTSKSGEVIGFVNPKEWRDMTKNVYDE